MDSSMYFVRRAIFIGLLFSAIFSIYSLLGAFARPQRFVVYTPEYTFVGTRITDTLYHDEYSHMNINLINSSFSLEEVK